MTGSNGTVACASLEAAIVASYRPGVAHCAQRRPLARQEEGKDYLERRTQGRGGQMCVARVQLPLALDQQSLKVLDFHPNVALINTSSDADQLAKKRFLPRSRTSAGAKTTEKGSADLAA